MFDDYISKYEYKKSLKIEIPIGTKVIKDQAFCYYEYVKKAVIPEGVEKIGALAFLNCDRLTKIDIPSTVTEIGASAFSSCYDLKGVSIVGVEEISDRAFDGCSSLKKVEISSKLKVIGNSAFQFCSSLKNFNFSIGVEEIGEDAFAFCDSLTKIVLDGSVKRVQENAFYGCNNVKSIYIGKNVEEIGNYAFASCINLKKFIVHPENKNYLSINGNLYTKDGKTLIQYALGKNNKTLLILNSVENLSRLSLLKLKNVTKFTVQKNNENFKAINGDLYSKNGETLIRYAVGKTQTELTIKNVVEFEKFAFQNARNLQKVTIGGKVKIIGFSAFSECDSLTTVKIEEGVERIERIAFSSLENLQKVYIPSTVNYIEEYAFDECYNVVLYVKKGSYAHQFAKNNELSYKLKK